LTVLPENDYGKIWIERRDELKVNNTIDAEQELFSQIWKRYGFGLKMFSILMIKI